MTNPSTFRAEHAPDVALPKPRVLRFLPPVIYCPFRVLQDEFAADL